MDNLLPNISESLIHHNASHQNHSHSLVEGGFLSGRNPFVFMQAVPLPTFIIQLVVIVCMSRFVKLFLSPMKQPAVIAETISGIILGPTVMGHIPNFSATIFSPPSLPFLNLMSNFGLVLFLFLVGLELDPRMLKKSMKNSLAISAAGMALPFAMGAGTSYILYVYVEPPSHQTGFVKYFLFLGVAMAITAFPVLARILTELNLLKTKVGGITISAAAVDDATSWCLLALVISLINAGSGLIAIYVFLMGLGYSLCLIFIVRPILVFILRRSGAFEAGSQPRQVMMFLALMIVFISAFITDAIGIHAIFGGFLAGIIMPHEGGFAYHITEKLEDIVAVLFLPLYFALSGLRTSIGALNDAVSWAIVALVICVACFGKIFGCTLAARATKMNWRESFTVGCLMNCKGLVELIVLNLGYDAGVISQRTFAIMVIMALVTTFITVPLVSFVYPPKYHVTSEESLGKSKSKKKNLPPSLLVCVNRIEQVPPILSVINLLRNKLNPIVPQSRKTSQVSTTESIMIQCLNPMEIKESNLKPLKLSASFKNPTPITGVTINALRLIELTDRDSSVMLQTSADALRDDPVTKMLRTFCEMRNGKGHVRSLVKVVTSQTFGETLVQTGEEVNAKYILVPWSGSGSMVEVSPVSPIQQAYSYCFEEDKRRQSLHTHTSPQHANFIQDLLAGAGSTVLILVDRGLDPIDNVQNYQQIYFPYFGGSDDREALEILVGLSAIPGVKINIIRYKGIKTSYRKLSGDSLSLSVAESGEAIINGEKAAGSGISNELGDDQDALDDDILSQCFGSLKQLNNRTSFQIYTNITYSEIESYTPVTTALQYLDHLSSSDLVVVGRGNAKLQNYMNNNNQQGRNADPERKRVLGDWVEAVLLHPCSASVLVVKANNRLESVQSKL